MISRTSGVTANAEQCRRTSLDAGDGGGPGDLGRLTDPAQACPLSFAQQRLWFLDQLHPGRPDHHMPITVRLTGLLDMTALQAAWDEVTARHDVLRTRYLSEADQPVQLVGHPGPPLQVLASTEDGLEELIQQLLRSPFRLDEAPPVRAVIIQLSDEGHVLVLVIHHIATDGRSNEVLLSDLAAEYRAQTGPPAARAEPPIRYADYGTWQRSQQDSPGADADLRFWREQLTGLQPVSLPADRPRPPQRSGRGAQRDFVVSASVRARLADVARQAGTTLFTAVLAAFHVLVAKHSGRADIAVGVPVSGRARPELEAMVGLFVNTVVLRARIRPELTFRELLTELHDTAQSAYAHAELPFERVVEDMRPERDLSGNPFFQLMFAMATREPSLGDWTGLSARPHPVSFPTAKFDLDIDMVNHGDRLSGSCSYATDLFDESTVDSVVSRYTWLLRQLAEEPDLPLRDHPALDMTDRLLLDATNDVAQDLDTAHTLHELIHEQAQRTPDAIAVESGPHRICYQELDLAARRFARVLAARGVSAGSPVGVWCNRGPKLLIALLGVLNAGAAFIPLDPDFPAVRVRVLLAEAGASHCVVDDPPCGPVDGLAVDVVTVKDDAGDPLTVSVDPDDVVSIYYTSGSTGKPKGVANPHRGWVNRMRWMQHRHQLRPGEGVLHKTVLSFDDSAVELFWPLIVGGRVVMLEPGLHRDPRAIVRAAAAHEVAVLQFVPSMLALFLEETAGSPLPALRHVISSGEALRPELVHRFHQAFLGTGCLLHNQWGPTEASIDATIHTCSPEDAARTAVPIGRPLTNYRVHVLDEYGTPVPPGVEGELYVGGVGLARCYWNDPAKTAEAFLPDPAVPGERLYRTGDRAVRGSDGAITFLGRRDHQVKIRGNRVELGEVERTLAECPDVADAVVTVWEPRPDDKRLVAYVVGRSGAVDTERVRYHLIERLPGYMLPAALVALPELPLTASGKVDRAQLPAPLDETVVAGRAPRSESELLVAEVWSRLLPATDAEADFFELGGHSLLATRIISGLRRALDLDLPLILLFENPTIAGLALAIERELLNEPEGDPR